MEIFITFKSRGQTFRVSKFLREQGCQSQLLDTPIGIYGSCALSVKTDYDGFQKFSQAMHNFDYFLGAYYFNGKLATRIL